MSKTIEVTKENFETIVGSNDIVLLDYWASWCGPCKKFGPIFESFAEKHPEVTCGKVNTESQPELASLFQVSAIPTVMAFRDKTLLFVQPGMLPQAALEELTTQMKALDMEKVKADIARQEAEAARAEPSVPDTATPAGETA